MVEELRQGGGNMRTSFVFDRRKRRVFHSYKEEDVLI